MSAEQMNAFLRHVGNDAQLQSELRGCDARAASNLAARLGYDVTVGDLIRYKSRSTTWELTDAELAVVAKWQPREQSFWWQYIWPGPGVDCAP